MQERVPFTNESYGNSSALAERLPEFLPCWSIPVSIVIELTVQQPAAEAARASAVGGGQAHQPARQRFVWQGAQRDWQPRGRSRTHECFLNFCDLVFAGLLPSQRGEDFLVDFLSSSADGFHGRPTQQSCQRPDQTL